MRICPSNTVQLWTQPENNTAENNLRTALETSLAPIMLPAWTCGLRSGWVAPFEEGEGDACPGVPGIPNASSVHSWSEQVGG